MCQTSRRRDLTDILNEGLIESTGLEKNDTRNTKEREKREKKIKQREDQISHIVYCRDSTLNTQSYREIHTVRANTDGSRPI